MTQQSMFDSKCSCGVKPRRSPPKKEHIAVNQLARHSRSFGSSGIYCQDVDLMVYSLRGSAPLALLENEQWEAHRDPYALGNSDKKCGPLVALARRANLNAYHVRYVMGQERDCEGYPIPTDNYVRMLHPHPTEFNYMTNEQLIDLLDGLYI